MEVCANWTWLKGWQLPIMVGPLEAASKAEFDGHRSVKAPLPAIKISDYERCFSLKAHFTPADSWNWTNFECEAVVLFFFILYFFLLSLLCLSLRNKIQNIFRQRKNFEWEDHELRMRGNIFKPFQAKPLIVWKRDEDREWFGTIFICIYAFKKKREEAW